MKMSKEIEIVVEGGIVVEVNGLPSDWVYYITDNDCAFLTNSVEGLEVEDE